MILGRFKSLTLPQTIGFQGNEAISPPTSIDHSCEAWLEWYKARLAHSMLRKRFRPLTSASTSSAEDQSDAEEFIRSVEGFLAAKLADFLDTEANRSKAKRK